MKRSFIAVSLVCLSAVAVSSAVADPVYTSFGSFSAATTGTPTVVNFNGITSTGGFTGETNPFTLSGVTFSVPSTQYFNATDASYYPTTYPGSGYVTYDDGGYLTINGSAPYNIVTILFPASTAIGFSYGGIFGPTSFPVTLSDGFTTTLDSSTSITQTGTLDYVGFTSTTPLTSITLDMPNTGNNAALDNFTFGTAAVTPEPSTFVLMLTGVAGVAGAARRKLRR